MVTEKTNNKLNDIHDAGLRGENQSLGYPDSLDLLSLLNRYPDLNEKIDFWEFRKAYDWLSEMVQRNHWRGRHRFIDHIELARRAGCSSAVLIAAATQLGLKSNHGSLYRAFKFPPFKD